MRLFQKSDHNLKWVYLIAFASLLIHLVTYNNLGFHRDELLYLALGNHLAAGYWSNPPLIGLIGFLAQLLPGEPLFATRLFPALAGAVVVVLTGLIARELGGKGYAQILACLLLTLSLLILRGFSMLQPVPFDILFWTLILYLFLRTINTSEPGYMLMTGVAFGLGILNKYMVVFLAVAIALSVLFTVHRRLWLRRYTWYAVAIAFLLFLPNLIWQLNHGFPVIHHMQQLKETQLVNVKRANILIDQLLMFTFSSILWLSGLIWLLTGRRQKNFRVFGFIYLVVLGLFVVLRGKSYYMAGLYPFMFAAGGVAWEKMLKPMHWRIAFAVFLALLSVPLIPGGIPVMKEEGLVRFFEKIPSKMGTESLLRWEDGKMHPLPQDFSDMLGWDELGSIVVNTYDTIKDKDRVFIYAENYGQAGAIDLFGKAHKLPNAISFSDSYVLWAPDTLPPNRNMMFYINGEVGDDVKPLFSRIDSIGSITNIYAREFGTTVYLCRNPRSDMGVFWSGRVKEVKQWYGLIASQP